MSKYVDGFVIPVRKDKLELLPRNGRIRKADVDEARSFAL